jgi:hypothetical protein
MLWFGNQMKHSLINPSQIQECDIHVYDDPISNLQFGINGNEMFIPFNTMGTIVHFESRAPTDWESHNLPIIAYAYRRGMGSSKHWTQYVGKEMPISRIVIAVPYTTVVLLD